MSTLELARVQDDMIGKHVELWDGTLRQITLDKVSGSPAFVRNRLAEHVAAGTLLRRGPLRTELRGARGYVASIELVVLSPTKIPGGWAYWPVWARHATRWVGAAGILFGASAVAGYATGGAVANALLVPALGIAALLAGASLIATAGKIATVCPGVLPQHCGNCPD